MRTQAAASVLSTVSSRLLASRIRGKPALAVANSMTLPSDRKVPRIHMHMAVLGRGWVKVMKEGGAATGARQIIGVMFSVPFALRVLTDDGVARPPAVLQQRRPYSGSPACLRIVLSTPTRQRKSRHLRLHCCRRRLRATTLSRTVSLRIQSSVRTSPARVPPAARD
jgi:hypothetical protein